MTLHPELLAKSEQYGRVPLIEHLRHVAAAAESIASHTGLCPETARFGAILHDIGKASPVFQERLHRRRLPNDKPFRHELASLFFIPLAPENKKEAVLEMVVAHHKSIYKDAGQLGLVDIDEHIGDVFDLHARDWEQWQQPALEILAQLGISTRPITQAEARTGVEFALDYCNNIIDSKQYGWSRWKGMLVAADHLASSVNEGTAEVIQRCFRSPDLSCYQTRSELYPLSLIPADDARPHTLVTAPTGAGKTNFLLRRCRVRVFYVLPFQASINAMYQRIKNDLKETGADVRLLHASSRVVLHGNGGKEEVEEKVLQDKVGASVKVLTPHQLAALAFGTRGYEALLIDLQGCDIILDEIHTYTELTQAIVLKLVEVLRHIGCRIHIGTATMPTVLYTAIAKLLGEVYEVSLSEPELDTYDRHIVHKAESMQSLLPVIEQAIAENQKVLLVCNQVQRAQQLFGQLDELFPKVSKMLLHSRYKRADRAKLEQQLKTGFDEAEGPCLVVSTQVVEVSLDISFDVMITEAAPLDALVQRFGRINRRRTDSSNRALKPVYVIQPPDSEQKARPYNPDVLQRSFEALPDGQVLHERDVQKLIDKVYPELPRTDIIETVTVFPSNRHDWLILNLVHRPKSFLLDQLEIDSAACITESDQYRYQQAAPEERVGMEIPIRYQPWLFKGLRQMDEGHRPFVVSDAAYDEVVGLNTSLLKSEGYEFL